MKSCTSPEAVSTFVKCVSTIICCACFVALTWEQIDQFFKKETGVGQTWMKRETRKFPLLVFCHENPFESDVVNLDNLRQNKEEYVKEAKEVNITYWGKFKLDYQFYKIKPGDYETKTLYTYSHGACKIFKVNLDIIAHDYICFIVGGEDNYLMYFLDEGEELFLTGDEWIFPVSMIHIKSTSNISIRKATNFRTPDFLRCTDYTMAEYAQCLIDIFKRSNNETGCRDILGEYHMPEVPFCPFVNTTSEIKTVKEEALAQDADYSSEPAMYQILYHFVRFGLNEEDGQCFIPCETNTYDIEHIPMHYYDEETLGGKILFVSYPSQLDRINREYVLYNFGSITAAVGGAVGLFLGLSFLAGFNKCNDVLYKCATDETKKHGSAFKTTIQVKPPKY